MTIAFCFLTYSDIENSQLWYNYLKNHMNDINIYIHSKFPIRNLFLKNTDVKKLFQLFVKNIYLSYMRLYLYFMKHI